MPDRKWWQLWSRREEPVVAEPKKPWETWDLPPVEERDPHVFYGPHPDSPEGIRATEALRVHQAEKARAVALRRITEQEQRAADKPEEGYTAPRMTRTAYEQLLRVRDAPVPEPARLYVVRRVHKETGLTEMRQCREGGQYPWTLDLLQAELVFATAARVPEDDEQHRYELTPVDALLWAVQSANETAAVETLHLADHLI